MPTVSKPSGSRPDIRHQAGPRKRGPHTILFANHKGGSGKSTIAMHVIVGLMQQGLEVASVDLDAGNATLTRFLDNRRRFAGRSGATLVMPTHHSAPARAEPGTEKQAETRFTELLDELAASHDVTVIDTPADGNPLIPQALAHATVMITPVSSFVDLDLLGWPEPTQPAAIRLGPFGGIAHAEQVLRQDQGRPPLDWVVLRNRLDPLAPKSGDKDEVSLDRLAQTAGFRVVHGIGDRQIFEDLYREGLTVLDLREDKIKIAMAFAHITARQELRQVLADLGKFEKRPEAAGATVTRLADRQRRPATDRPPLHEVLKKEPPESRPELTLAETIGPETAPSYAALADAASADAAPLDAASADAPGPAARRLLLLYDPRGGRRGLRSFRWALRRLAVSGFELTVQECEGGGDAEACARAAKEHGFESVVVAGSDRTVNEVAGALADTGVPLGVLPIGPSNVVADRYGLPGDPETLVDAIANGSVRPLRLGRVGNRTFSVAASIGFPRAAVDALAVPSPGPLRLAALFLRLLAALPLHRPASHTAAIGERIFTAAAVLIVNDPETVGIPPDDQTEGGGGGEADDGNGASDGPGFHICLCQRAGRFNALRYALAMASGRLALLSDVTVLRARGATISAPEGAPVFADGERATDLPAQFSATNARLNVFTAG